MSSSFRGYFVLGSTNSNPPQLELAPQAFSVSGNHTGSKYRGEFSVITDFEPRTLHIPSRDKQVEVMVDLLVRPQFLALVEKLDSQPGPNYRSKILTAAESMPTHFYGAVNNVGVSKHGSLAIIDMENQLKFYGLHDSNSDTSYFMWGEDEDLRDLQYRNPLRYLVYRFPPMKVVFLPGEAIGSKWWRWTRSNSLLHAFNALEMRLANGSVS